MRDQTEWVELIEVGANELVEADTNKIIDAVKRNIGRKVEDANQLYCVDKRRNGLLMS